MRAHPALLRELDLNLRISWRIFFRWLWRYTVAMLALLSTAALVLLVYAGFSYLAVENSQRVESMRVDAREAEGQEDEEGARLRVEFVREFNAPSHMLAALIEDNTGRGALYMTRNLVLYDLVSGAGRRVFPNDDGHVGRYAPVTAQCAPTRSLSAPRPAGREGEAAAPAATPPEQAVGVIALWRQSGESLWRLGIVTLAHGEWREVAADVASLETLSGAARGGCRAILRRDDGLHAVTFPLSGAGDPVDTPLALE